MLPIASGERPAGRWSRRLAESDAERLVPVTGNKPHPRTFHHGSRSRACNTRADMVESAAPSRAPGNLDLFVIGFDNRAWSESQNDRRRLGLTCAVPWAAAREARRPDRPPALGASLALLT